MIIDHTDPHAARLNVISDAADEAFSVAVGDAVDTATFSDIDDIVMVIDTIVWDATARATFVAIQDAVFEVTNARGRVRRYHDQMD